MLLQAVVGLLLWLVYMGLSMLHGHGSHGSQSSPTPKPFPTNVGYSGKTRLGKAPFRAELDRLNVSGPDTAPVELRWIMNGTSIHEIHRNWGTATPYYPATDLFPETKYSYALPEQCHIRQVHILYRHGARYPAHGKRQAPGKFGKKVKKARRKGKLSATGQLEFLNKWTYNLGRAALVPLGKQEMFAAGVEAQYAYGALLKDLKYHKPVFRTTSQSRMLDSARYWTLGFFGWDAPKRVNLEVIPEAPGFNNTLSPKHTCPGLNAPKPAKGPRLGEQWRAVYLRDAQARLQKNLQGIKLSLEDVLMMMQLCAFETTGLGYSDFCSLFTPEEWAGYEYETDLSIQEEYGFTPKGRALGIGWVTEFAERLAQARLDIPVTTQNMTLNNDERFFPLTQPIYVDFTHDKVIMSIISALNLTQLKMPLDPTQIQHKRRYRTNRVTPFAARLVCEVVECDGNRFVRVRLNDAVVPLNMDQGCAPRPDNLCDLESFVRYIQTYAYNASHFDDVCFRHAGIM